MNRGLKRACSLCTCVAIIAGLAGCGSSDSSSNGDESTETTTTRQTITTAPVVENMGDLDLSDVQNKSDVDPDFKLEFEAENCDMTGSAMNLDLTNFGDYSGKGFIAFANKDDEITFTGDFDVEGSYDITLIACSSNEGSENLITIDGSTLASFTVNDSSFGEVVAEKVVIPAGSHKIGIKADDGKFYVDKIIITPAAEIDLSQYEVTAELSNPNASDETKRLYNFLTDVYGKYTISGQYCADNGGMTSAEFSEIYDKLGKYPAIMGLDLINNSPSRVANGASDHNLTLTAEDWWLNQGGIVTICWHWNAPEPYLGYNGGAWWQGFYSEFTNFNLAAALDGSDPEGYDYLIRDIDAIAEKLIELDDYHVPVLFRPLHEGGGDPQWNNPWFWWGSSGADAYKELWTLMYDRLTNYHHINNLIWVWNGQNPDYYPGDEYVDILGYDVYAAAGDHSSQKKLYDYTKETTQTNKIVAMTENGTLFDPDSAFSDGTRWAWFSTWNGEFTLENFQLGSKYTSLEMWQKIYDSERVLTLDELPDLKSYPLDTEKYLAENQ